MKNYLFLVLSFCASLAAKEPCTPSDGLLPKVVDKLTGNSFTLRDYKFVQSALQATSYSLKGLLSMGTPERAQFLILEQQATKKALAWEKSTPWYSPALKIDLYNPAHVLALTIAAYTSCRLAENCIVKPACRAARNSLYGQ